MTIHMHAQSGMYRLPLHSNVRIHAHTHIHNFQAFGHHSDKEVCTARVHAHTDVYTQPYNVGGTGLMFEFC